MKAGAPCKLNSEVQQAICAAIAAGNNREDAALCAGIGVRTLRSWLARGRKQRAGKFRQFLAAVKKAEAEACVASVKAIRDVQAATWQAAAWWLERKYPEKWGSDRAAIRELQKGQKELEAEIARLKVEHSNEPPTDRAKDPPASGPPKTLSVQDGELPQPDAVSQ